MKFQNIGALAAVLVLAGCGGTGVTGERYVGRQGSQAWFATASPQTIAAYYEKQCSAYGHKPGSDGMTRCIQETAMVGRQSADARAASFNQGLANASAIYQQNAAINAMNRPRMTTCNQFGHTVNCTSY